MLAALRAKDIVEGKPKLTNVDVDRPISVAATEIDEGLITYVREEEKAEV